MKIRNEKVNNYIYDLTNKITNNKTNCRAISISDKIIGTIP